MSSIEYQFRTGEAYHPHFCSSISFRISGTDKVDLPRAFDLVGITDLIGGRGAATPL